MIGLDVVDLVGFRAQLADAASTFVVGTFTEQERRTAAGRPGRDPARHLGARFAAKEAFLKAWSGARRGPPLLHRVDMREIEVVNDAWGRPSIVLHGDVARAFDALGRLHVSISHDGDVAMAIVQLICGETSGGGVR